MATVEAHYDQVLSDIYSWMFGGFESGVERNARLFERLGIRPSGSGLAVDLGAGCGFQSIPLARVGFAVTAIDLDRKLLEELEGHAGGLPVRTVQDDLLNLDLHVDGAPELIVCMTDTILHLDSADNVAVLFAKAFDALERGGLFIITFRDLSTELEGLDRFIPVRSDENLILTCFLEYEPRTVKVHDLVHRRTGDGWTLAKSYYRKLRLSRAWVESALTGAGFRLEQSAADAGLITIVAARD